MSNRAAIVTIMTNMDAHQSTMRAFERSTDSFKAKSHIRRASLAISIAKIELALALQIAVDPAIDIAIVDAAKGVLP